MTDTEKTRRLAGLLLDARTAAAPLAALPDELASIDAAGADAVQLLCADRLGPVGGYKVLQVADREGSFGFIPASAIHTSPATMASAGRPLKIEIEIAFRIGRDLPGRADGVPYSADEVRAAVSGAFAAFEILGSRLPPKPPPLAARADAMSNHGLVVGPELGDWQGAVRADVAASLVISGRVVVSATGGHPSVDPFHSVPWLANALVRIGRPLVAGQVVTTGAFGGSHPIAPGDEVTGEIAGFAPISFRLEP